ncbi:MAG: hypothetical protein NTY37_13380 [Methanothrix sp.]|nr:hypothetical protein [Methanothrix sp.]
MIDEDCVERIYKDAEDLFVSMKLRKRKKISLDEVAQDVSKIHVRCYIQNQSG